MGFEELTRTQKSIEAYKALGQEIEEHMLERLDHNEARIQDFLKILSELHFNSTTHSEQEHPIPAKILDVILQLKAEREVESSGSKKRYKKHQKSRKKEI